LPFDGETATFGHRVASVDDQVEQHLLDLGRVRVDETQVLARTDLGLDVLAENALEHVLEIRSDRVEVQQPRLLDLLAAESQQLSGEPGRALGCLQHVLEPSSRRVALRDLLASQLTVTGDHSQHVVEVVGHTPGQPADRLQLLRAVECVLGLRLLLLGQLAARDVLELADEIQRIAGRVTHL